MTEEVQSCSYDLTNTNIKSGVHKFSKNLEATPKI
jgi:hypothetical protein